MEKAWLSFLDYFPAQKSVIFLDEPNRLDGKWTGCGGGISARAVLHRAEKGRDKIFRKTGFVLLKRLQKELNRRNCIALCALEPRPGRLED